MRYPYLVKLSSPLEKSNRVVSFLTSTSTEDNSQGVFIMGGGIIFYGRGGNPKCRRPCTSPQLPFSTVESRLLFVSTRFLNADLIAPDPAPPALGTVLDAWKLKKKSTCVEFEALENFLD